MRKKDNTDYYINRHSCFLLQYHIVFVTKYRHPVLTGRVKDVVYERIHYVADQRGFHILEINGESDHVHILMEADTTTSPAELANVLKKRFINGSTLICGGNSSGKTTILNALKEEIPHDVSVLITQQSDELTTKTHTDMMFMHSLSNTDESKAKYDLKNISIAGLTMDVDFFIIGEIKGEEARYLLNAAYTGQLCAATIHAPSAPKAIDKLVDYALMDSKYTKDELMKMMDCFNTIIFMKKYKVCQVYAVKGYDYEKKALVYEAIWENGGFVNEYDKTNIA